jgi:hypothetical protein
MVSSKGAARGTAGFRFEADSRLAALSGQASNMRTIVSPFAMMRQSRHAAYTINTREPASILQW